MFGYVRPVKDELRVKELELYRAAYCGLCHALGRKYGFLARLTLNYDLTFLAMLFSCPDGQPERCARRCPVHPLRGKCACACGAGVELAADENVILVWHKLRDDAADRGALRGLPARLGALALNGAYRKAAAACPEFDRQVRRCLDRLRKLERARSASIDRTADTFADILRAAVPPDAEPARVRVLEQLLYHLGRWVYLVDAWDDLKDDRKTGSYNPLELRFDGAPEKEADYMRATLTHSVRLAGSALALGDFGGWTPILENILYLGLPAAQEAVLTGRWREVRENRERVTGEIK